MKILQRQGSLELVSFPTLPSSRLGQDSISIFAILIVGTEPMTLISSISGLCNGYVVHR